MTDTSFSSASLRIQRGRNPSSSGSQASRNYDDGSLRLPAIRGDHHGGGGAGGAGGQQPPHHNLRSVSSRFSLSEHFAATRSLYEFGFDDASSYAAPSVMMTTTDDTSEALTPREGKEEDDDVMHEEQQRREVMELLEGDFYDILCLPRGKKELLTKEEVSRAYHRMFLLFYPETYPDGMQGIARRQFDKAREGFEVLVDERRRRRYDGDNEDEDRELDSTGCEGMMSSEVGVRVDARQGLRGCQPLDFNVSNSSSTILPRLATRLSFLGITSSIPSLTLCSSVYGIISPMSTIPMHILSSPHQPLQPATSPRHRLLQLVDNKLSPAVSARLTHDIINDPKKSKKNKKETKDPVWISTRAEYSIDVLPSLSPSIRLFHSLRLRHDEGPPPTILETSVKPSSWWSFCDEATTKAARGVIGVHHPFSRGTGFARIDTGDWTLAPETCRFLTSSAVPRAEELRYASFPLQVAPTVELGFTNGPASLVSGTWSDNQEDFAPSLLSGTPTPASGTWTAATTFHPLTDLTATILYTSPPLPLIPSTNIQLSLSASTIHPAHICIRHLIPASSSISFGLELSLSRFSTHISLHIKRLNRHVSLPFLFPSIEHLQPPTLFLASAVPFLALAACKFLTGRRASRKANSTINKEKARRHSRKEEALRALEASSPLLQAAIANRREEADHLTGLLAQPISNRQKHHASQGGLVILSAKFGLAFPHTSPLTTTTPTPSLSSSPIPVLRTTTTLLPGPTFHPDEEIADVTVALAALVDDQTGGLWIPEGVRKGCIPGFWDPAPGREKLLLVRYSWRGKEDIVAVRGDEELVLPPR